MSYYLKALLKTLPSRSTTVKAAAPSSDTINMFSEISGEAAHKSRSGLRLYRSSLSLDVPVTRVEWPKYMLSTVINDVAMVTWIAHMYTRKKRVE